MIFDELQQRYGVYVAEMVRQALTLQQFEELEIEELAPYFEWRAEKVYQEYRTRRDAPPKGDVRGREREVYLNILRRRWQEADELATLVRKADQTVLEIEQSSINRA